jgi:hypothetical protein
MWVRVLSLQNEQGYLVRTAPDNPDVVYVAKSGSTTLYYSSAAGDTKWYNRSSRYNIQDIAVESEDVAYIGRSGADTVSKSVNSGFTWGTEEDTEMIRGNIHQLITLGEDQLIAASTLGYVSYTTDGNETWNRILQPIYPDTNPNFPVCVTANGLETGNLIWACSQGNERVMRWTIGQDQTKAWANMEVPDKFDADGYAYKAYGVVLANGVLYAVTSNATSATVGNSIVLRSMRPTVDDPEAKYWSDIGDHADYGGTDMKPPANYALPVYGTNTAAPSNLSVSSTPAFNKLWVVNMDNNNTPGNANDEVASYMDMLAFKGPELIGPADGTQIKINPISGEAYDVSFSWKRPSDALRYDLWISLDPEFDEKVSIFSNTSDVFDSTVAMVIGPSGIDNVAGGKLTWMAGTTYYWKARANEEGPIHSPFSEVRSVTVEPGAAVVPVILSPENGASDISTAPSFSWSPVSGATKYEFQLSADTSFASPMASAQLAETGIQPAVTLEAGKTYFWRVRSVEPIIGGWSAISNFSVAVPAAPAPPPVKVEQVPPPVIQIPPAPPAQEIVIPPAPAPVQPISQGLLWAVIIIGAVLVIAVIVLIVRTRRTV